MMKPMGVPNVIPFINPDKISTRSLSFRGEVIVLWPGLRRSTSCCIASKSIGSPDGNPSITPPMATPCDSPKVVSFNIDPKVLFDTLRGSIQYSFLKFHLNLHPSFEHRTFIPQLTQFGIGEYAIDGHSGLLCQVYHFIMGI